ncbi:MAG: site-2 protease family protein, partial [Candidatus Cloacimonadota bacterium]|nr:site-2 protease family protein [Candidatus Cloacimonadota bacterium]
LIRDEKTLNKTIKLSDNLLEEGTKIIGVTQYLPLEIVEKFSPLKSIQLGVLTTISTIYANYYGLVKLIKNPSALKDNVGGPVMMVAVSKQYSEKGFSTVLSFIAIINILLMVMNLLPIPILDGGQILFSFIEAIKGNPLSIKVQGILQQAGLFILLSLTIYVFINDFSRITQRVKSIKNIEEPIND